MSLGLYSSPIARCLIYLKRIALALERLAPPAPRARRPSEFSVATDADLLAGWKAAHPSAEWEERRGD